MESPDLLGSRELLVCLTGLNTLLYQASTAKQPHNATHTNAAILNKISEVSTFSRTDFAELLNGADDLARLQVLVRLADGLYEFACVPTFKGREDIGYDRIDFAEVTGKVQCVMPCLTFLIERTHPPASGCVTEQVRRPRCAVELLRRGLLLYAEHAAPRPWTSASTLTAASQLLSSLLTASSCVTPTEMLCDPPPRSGLTKGMVGGMMAELKPKLQKGIWKNNPASAWVFKWTLLQVRFPHLTPLLPVILPPCLLLTDDHDGAHKAAGVSCLHHVTREATLEELRSGGRAEVVVAAVEHALYAQEEEVLRAVLPALPDVLATVCPSPSKALPPRDVTRYDALLERLLQCMELEQRLSARRLYARHLPALLSTMGLTLCRHLPAILSVVDSYLQVPDGPKEEARLAALTILHATITQAWPRMRPHTATILTALLRLVHDITDGATGTLDESVPRRRLVEEAVVCARLLRAVSGGRTEELLRAVIDDARLRPGEGGPAHAQCVTFAQEVLDDPT